MQVYEDLLACYMAEVRYRHREFRMSEELSSQLQSVATWLTEPNTKLWLLLCGSCGNGKSTMAKALRSFYNLHPIKDPRDGHPMGLVMTNAKSVSDACLNDSKSFESLVKKPMLAIDDLGTEPCELHLYGNVFTPLIEMLTDRYEEQRITIITTNLTPNQIREHYGARIADRLNEMADKVIFKNETYRIDSCILDKNSNIAKQL